MRVLTAGKGEVIALGFAPERSWLVASQAPGGMHAWDLAAADLLGSVRKVNETCPRSFCFTPDGEKLLLAQSTHRTAVDLETGASAPIGPGAGSRPTGSMLSSGRSTAGAGDRNFSCD